MRVKSNRHWVTPLAERLNRRLDKGTSPDACWIWTGCLDRKGYGMIWLGKEQGGHGATHRAAYQLAYGPIPDGLYVCHRCDTPACCRPDHLFLGTAADNSRDMLSKGRHRHLRSVGERNPIAKLTETDVRAIRLASASGITNPTIARRYGVTSDAIWRVVARKNWRHIE